LRHEHKINRSKDQKQSNGISLSHLIEPSTDKKYDALKARTMTDITPPESQLTIETLPIELRERIIQARQEPELIRAYTRASRRLYEATTNPYLRRLCAEPISWQEIQRYVATGPKSVGLFGGLPRDYWDIFNYKYWTVQLYTLARNIYDDRDDSPQYFEQMLLLVTSWSIRPQDLDLNELDEEQRDEIVSYPFLYRPILMSTYLESDRYGVVHGSEIADLAKSQQRHWRDVKLEPYPTVEGAPIFDPRGNLPMIDLLSQYRILFQRLGCVARNSTYAKEQVVSQLEAQYQVFRQQDDLISLIVTWTYLYLQAWAFDIYPLPAVHEFNAEEDNYFSPDGKFEWGNDPDKEDEINLMIDEVTMMYQKVRRAIDQLD
jgi:hypothetical protein